MLWQQNIIHRSCRLIRSILQYSNVWNPEIRLEDIHHGCLGTVVDVDDATINVLFVIEKEDGSEILLPAHEEFRLNIDHKKKCVKVDIPEGWLE